MKNRTLFILAIGSLSFLNLDAQVADCDSICIRPVEMVHDGSQLVVSFQLHTGAVEVKKQNALVLTPYLCAADKKQPIRSVGIYGKHRYLYETRNGDGKLMAGKDELCYKWSERPDTVFYEERVDFEPWMRDCQLFLKTEEYACCQQLLSDRLEEIGQYREVTYVPEWVYVSPQVETVKSRSLSGSAYVDFPVNKTVIRPEYRNNGVELNKILSTIDAVKEDKDVTITSIFIKGYASPEGSYAGNERLAKGRVAALKAYVSDLNPQQKDLIRTEYEPEDWAGLRDYVMDSQLEHRSEILALIDSDLDPDKKDWKIKRTYPAEYQFLLKECYPALRHSDYRVEYIVRSYTDVEEIKRLIKENPKNLSLNEFYQAAQTYQQGSEEFNEIFDIAVRMYPDDEIANLNAANTAMGKKDMVLAARYLERAGQTPNAQYARGIFEALAKNYPQAESYFKEAVAGGVAAAEKALQTVKELHSIYHQ